MMDMRRRDATPRLRPRAAGASPLRTTKPARQWNLSWIKPLCLWLVYGSLCAGIVASVIWLDPKTRLEQVMNRPIAGVSVESEFKYINQQQTQELVTAHLSPTFLELDMAGLKAALETNPWIDKVIIARTWPDKLLVRIQEQKPIARWGREGFINLRGELVRVSDVSRLAHLPELDCEERYAAELMQKYQIVKNIVSANGLTPTRLSLDKTLALTIEFSPALTIRLGREKTLEKLQNIAKILRTDLSREVARMHQIDMRYDNGFAVSWNDNVASEPLVTNPPANPIKQEQISSSAEE